MKMKTHIQSTGLTLGATPSGADWCLKALHPADPLVEVRGIPDESAVPSVFVNYQTVSRVSCQPTATGTWSYDGLLIPHPVGFMNHMTTDSTGRNYSMANNAQLSGTTHLDKYNSFRAQARRWRLAYMSVTVHQDGPDLANQGTIVVSQVPCQPKKFNFSMVSGAAVTPHAVRGDIIALPDIQLFSNLDAPSYAASQATPNAYFNNSKYGAYVPLKLTKTHQAWHSDSDHVTGYGYPNGYPGFGSADPSDMDESGAAYNNGHLYLGNPSYSAGFNQWPFMDLPATAFSMSSPTDSTAAPCCTSISSPVTSPMCNDVWAHLSAQNLATTTSLTFFIRAGYELQVVPTSILSPQAKISPPSDEVALRAYFAIARELKDAYPEDYNSLDKLASVIGGILKGLSPALLAIPGIGTVASGAASFIGQGLSGLGSYLASRAEPSERQVRTVVSAAELDKAKEKRKEDQKRALSARRVTKSGLTIRRPQK